MSALAIPRGMFRSRSLLDLAHRCERCMNCGAVTPDGCEPAHSNLMVHGKGVGEKSHDCYHAALCHRCHRWYDNQGGEGMDPSKVFKRSERQAMWSRAFYLTLLHYFRMGWIGVRP